MSTASLRGLGGQNTLVLLNGKRLTAASGEIQGVYGVNLDSIPFSAIERVEMLKDGASAVYGSDAIGGVINFILRQDFRGAEVTAVLRHAHAQRRRRREMERDGHRSASATSPRTSTTSSSRRTTRRPTRSIRTSATSPTAASTRPGPARHVGQHVPGAHHDRGHRHAGLPELRAGHLRSHARSALRRGACVFDPAAADGVNAIPEQETTSFFASGRWQFNPNWQLYGTAAYTKVDTRYVIQPTPLSDQIFYGPDPPNQLTATFLLPPSSPYYPTALANAAGVGGQPLNLRYRAYALGLRDTTDENEAFQGVAGIKGTAWNWDFDFDFVYSQNETQLSAPTAASRAIRSSCRCSTPAA